MQVFQYDGTQHCDEIPYVILFIIGLLLVSFFVVPVPFIVSYIIVKRPRVRFLVLKIAAVLRILDLLL